MLLKSPPGLLACGNNPGSHHWQQQQRVPLLGSPLVSVKMALTATAQRTPLPRCDGSYLYPDQPAKALSATLQSLAKTQSTSYTQFLESHRKF